MKKYMVIIFTPAGDSRAYFYDDYNIAISFAKGMCVGEIPRAFELYERVPIKDTDKHIKYFEYRRVFLND